MAKKKVTKTDVTKTPVDLQIKIDPVINSVAAKLSLSASWSISDADHGGGQKMKWQYSSLESKDEPAWQGKTPAATDVVVTKTQTSKTFIERDFTNYYPASGKEKLVWVHVEITGKRKKWKTETSQKVTTHNMLWSNPAARTIHIIHPPIPEISDNIAAGDTDFSKKFSWTVAQSSIWIGVDYKEKVERYSSKYKKKKLRNKIKSVEYRNDDEIAEIFYDTEWQTILVDNLTNKNFDVENEANWVDSAAHTSEFTGHTTPGQESCEITVTEDNSTWSGNYSYTRYVRVRSRGPGGASPWDYNEFIYYNAAAPQAPTSAKMDTDGNITMSDKEVASEDFPSKYISYQYLTDTPETSIAWDANAKKYKVTISPPSGSTSWVEAIRVPAGTTVTFPTEKPINDKLTWTRKVFVGKDDSSRAGQPIRVSTETYAPLTPPTGIQISDIDVTQKRMKVSATNNSTVPSSYLLVYCRNENSDTKVAGLIPHGESSGVTIQVPIGWDLSKTDIGVRAVLGDYSYDSVGKSYSVDPIYMESEIVWDGGSLPSPPTNFKLATTETTGTIIATWDWTWEDSNTAEISWSETKEAWESTSPPSVYTITDTHTGKWYITGLSVGTWYVRVRLGRTEGDVTTWGMYAETDPIKVVSVPDRPYLMITPKIITPDQEVKLSWAYSSEDGAALKTVYIARDGHLTDNPIVTDKQSTITLSQEDLGWQNGDEISLRICTESVENKLSEWSHVTNDSTFRVVALPPRPEVTFISGWEADKSVTVDTSTITENCVVSLPFSFTIGGVEDDNIVTVRIRREIDDVIQKPDEVEYPVYANDLMYFNNSLEGPGMITVNQEDLITQLDDNKYYHLIIDNVDKYGQTYSGAPIDYRFRVVWDHKAVEPEAEITVDTENDVAFIKTIQPDGYQAGDICDIYRLSADKPELIIEGAEFGTWYVDEYPTIGEFGGYKVVYRTFNGDIRTDGGYAETYYEGEDYALTDFMSIIDFGKDSVLLRYNLSLSNTWNKDFSETKYLGGSIQGDWNPAVSRTGSIKATVSIQEDPMHDYPEETIEAMRRLAVYAGICHVRTPDGSNFYANVDVQEDREEKWVTQLAKFSLNITRVDSPDAKYIMRTKNEWEEDQEEE